MRLKIVAIAVLLALGALWLAPVHAQSGGAGRPIILMVHGRGQLGRDTTSLRVELKRSLEAGLQLPVTDSLFRDEDVRLVWYADVLDPASEEGCRYHAANPRSRERWEQRGGAQAFWDLARGVLGLVATGLDSTGADEARGLLGDLLFAADLWKRCGAEHRLAVALDAAAKAGRPVVLVSHSFGALVTYGFLDGFRQDPDAPRVDIRHWITIGSMLGVPAVRQLLLGDSGSSLPRPSIVRTWLNVRDPDDALSAPVAGDGAASNASEIETRARGGAVAHELSSYLRDPIASAAIVHSWCASFGMYNPAPEWCSRVPDPVSSGRP